MNSGDARYTPVSQEAVAYESRTAGGLLRGEVRAHVLFGEKVLHAISTFLCG